MRAAVAGGLIAAALAVATPVRAQIVDGFVATCTAQVKPKDKLHLDGPAGIDLEGSSYACSGPDMWHFTVPQGTYLCITDVNWYGLAPIYANLANKDVPGRAYSFDKPWTAGTQGIPWRAGEVLHLVLASGSDVVRYVTVSVRGYLVAEAGQGERRACLR